MQTDARRAAPSAAALSAAEAAAPCRAPLSSHRAAEAAARPRGRGSASQQPTACRPARPTRRSPGKPLLPSPPRRGAAYRPEKPGRDGEPSRGRAGAAMAAGSSPGGSEGRRGHFLCRAADAERWRKPRRPLLGGTPLHGPLRSAGPPLPARGRHLAPSGGSGCARSGGSLAHLLI